MVVQFAKFVLDGNRPTMPDTVTPWIADLIRSGWASEPTERPTMAQIVRTLEDAARELDVETSQRLTRVETDQPVYRTHIGVASRLSDTVHTTVSRLSATFQNRRSSTAPPRRRSDAAHALSAPHRGPGPLELELTEQSC